MNKLITPVLDHVRNGLRHRKWVFPARVYTGPDRGSTQEKWIYAVGEAPYVVTFMVGTGRYPGGYDIDAGPPRGLDESWHRAEAGGYGCMFLDGVACRCDGNGLNAEEWYVAQPKDDTGFVADAAVFAYVCYLYDRWNESTEEQE